MIPKEATAMFQQQIQYAKNAFKWAEMQKAADDIKGLVSSPELQQKQPNNVNYIREYFKNAIGMGESQVARALDNSIRDGLGISPDLISSGVGTVKSLFITQKLAASAGYTMANMIQASNVLPYLMNLRGQGYKGNPAVAMVVGVPAGMAMGMSHYMKAIGGEYIDQLPNQFFKDAFRYAEDNGVTARSVYDEAPLNTTNKALDSVGRVQLINFQLREFTERGFSREDVVANVQVSTFQSILHNFRGSLNGSRACLHSSTCGTTLHVRPEFSILWFSQGFSQDICNDRILRDERTILTLGK